MAVVEDGCSPVPEITCLEFKQSAETGVFKSQFYLLGGGNWCTWDYVLTAGLLCCSQGDRFVCINMAAEAQPQENRDKSW